MNWLLAILGKRKRTAEREPLSSDDLAQLAREMAETLQLTAIGILALPFPKRGDVFDRTDQIEETAEWLRGVARDFAEGRWPPPTEISNDAK